MNEKKNSSKVILQKDLKSFEELFHLYYPRLKNYAFRLLQNNEEAEDLVQDVFLQLWNKGIKSGNNNVASYLFTSLKNRCLNILKHKVVEDKYKLQSANIATEELYHISMKGKEEFVPMEEMLMFEIEKIISETSEKCQAAFRLKWFEGKKIHEIAEIMDISTTMVDKHLAKGKEIIRKKLNPDMYILFLMKVSSK
jgi:RNA polymerase sigma-70 factor, ECF subfamily